MTDPVAIGATDIGDYCRRVEDHLTRANAGHLVRIVGTGFEVVRGWASAGVPLSVVYRGIDMKAERHREGKAARPLRIEFCEPDVRAVFDNWRRAIGLSATALANNESPIAEEGESPAEVKRPSLTKQLDRAIEKLSRIGGRLELAAELRDRCDRVLQQLADLRGSAARARGPAKDAIIAQLPPLDAELAAATLAHAPVSLRASVAGEAEAELQTYRGRLREDAWRRSLDVTIDRMLRDRLGVPILDL